MNDALGAGGYIKYFLGHIFTKAIDNEIMNLRELLKATRYQLTELRKGGYHEDLFSDNFQKIFDKAILIAIHSFSNTEAFIEKIKIIKENNKTKTEARMPFGKYIATMLKSLGMKITEDETADLSWEGYKIKKNPDRPNSIIVVGNLEENLFYDLLIKYVENRKYLKNNYHDYE